jgi:hypothetical protein
MMISWLAGSIHVQDRRRGCAASVPVVSEAAHGISARWHAGCATLYLALRKKTGAELAVKYGRSHQAIKQFSARNAAEIAGRRQVLLGEVDAEAANLWVSDKTTRIALHPSGTCSSVFFTSLWEV